MSFGWFSLFKKVVYLGNTVFRRTNCEVRLDKTTGGGWPYVKNVETIVDTPPMSALLRFILLSSVEDDDMYTFDDDDAVSSLTLCSGKLKHGLNPHASSGSIRNVNRTPRDIVEVNSQPFFVFFVSWIFLILEFCVCVRRRFCNV